MRCNGFFYYWESLTPEYRRVYYSFFSNVLNLGYIEGPIWKSEIAYFEIGWYCLHVEEDLSI